MFSSWRIISFALTRTIIRDPLVNPILTVFKNPLFTRAFVPCLYPDKLPPVDNNCCTVSIRSSSCHSSGLNNFLMGSSASPKGQIWSVCRRVLLLRSLISFVQHFFYRICSCLCSYTWSHRCCFNHVCLGLLLLNNSDVRKIKRRAGFLHIIFITP